MMKIKLHYAWIVLLLAFIGLLSAQGVRLSFGAFVTPWENELQSSRGEISFIAFVSYAIFAISQPYVGKLIDKYGVKYVLSFSVLLIGFSTIITAFATKPIHLILLYGVIASFGFGGASNVAGSVVITNWFKTKRGFAIGLMSAGTASGQLLLVPLSIFMIEKLGWHLTVILLGSSLCLIIFPMLFIFLKNFPNDKGITAYGEQKLLTEDINAENKMTNVSIFQLLSERRFLFLLFPFFVCGVTTSGLIDTHLIPFSEACGFPTSTTSIAVGLLAAFNIAGTICSGFIADRWSSKNLLAILYGTRAFTVFILIIIFNDVSLFGFFIEKSNLLIIFAISFGIVDFATVAPTVKLATEYFQNLSVGMIIGWLFLSHQVGSAIGAYIPGVLFDITGSYDIAFVSSIVLLSIATILSFLLPDTNEKLNPIK
jgi:MFS family permease